MAFPPDPVAADKTNTTDIPDDHPDHHNELANAINDTVDELVQFESDTATALAGKQPLDADLTALAAANNSAVLAATTASFTTADETKLDGIEAAAEVNDTAAEILTKVKTVDGSGSGLDADLLDGQDSTAFQAADADLTDLAARWVPASASGPASLDFREDSDNGTNRARIIAPASLASDVDLTLPATSGTLARTADIVAQTPWLSNIDGDGHALDSVATIGIGGVASANSGVHLTMDGFADNTTGASFVGHRIDGQYDFTTTAAGSWTGLGMTPTVASTVNLASVFGLNFAPKVSGTITTTSLIGINGNISVLGGGTATTARAVLANVGQVLSTVTTGVGIDITSSAVVGSFGTMIGLRITGLAAGTTKWGMQVGDYQSHHHGKLTLGGTTAPTYGLDLIGTTQDRAAIALKESATPTNPSQDNQVVVYCVSNKIVFAWNDAGTMRYKYLDLTGTGVTWVHSTTAP